MADPEANMVDDDTLATVRLLHYPVQFEPDPASPAAVAWVVDDVIDGDVTGQSRADYLEDIRRALATDENLAAKLEVDVHTDAQIRAFLRAVAARLEPVDGTRG